MTLNGRVPLPPHGVIVPMITPLTPGREVDTESLRSLVRTLIGEGVAGLLVLGSSGENAALSAENRRAAVRAAVDAASGHSHVMAGVASLGTEDAMVDAAAFANLGADALLLSAPFGFALSQVELAGHFRATAGAADGTPVVAYEVPSRVNVSLGIPLLVELGEEGIIAGVKDSSGSLGGSRMRTEAFQDHGLSHLRHYTGSEECIDSFLLAGGHGCVPGLANVVAPLHVKLCGLAAAGDWQSVASLQGQIAGMLDLYFHPLPTASFSAQFFAIVKEALVQRGVIAHNTTALPFVPADQGIQDHVSEMLCRYSELTAE